LLAAIVLRKRDHDGAALLFTVVAAAAQLFETRGDAIEVLAHRLDLTVELVALRRLAAPEEEEAAAAVATQALALRGEAIELLLLPVFRLLLAANLVGAAGVLRIAVEARELCLQALTGGTAIVLLIPALIPAGRRIGGLRRR
jgi:hypothetical protein